MPQVATHRARILPVCLAGILALTASGPARALGQSTRATAADATFPCAGFSEAAGVTTSADLHCMEHVSLVFKNGLGFDSSKLIESVAGQVGIH